MEISDAAKEIAKTMMDCKWSAQQNHYGLWLVGPEMSNGKVMVMGMGRTFEEAFQMAERTKDRK